MHKNKVSFAEKAPMIMARKKHKLGVTMEMITYLVNTSKYIKNMWKCIGNHQLALLFYILGILLECIKIITKVLHSLFGQIINFRFVLISRNPQLLPWYDPLLRKFQRNRLANQETVLSHNGKKS